MKTTSSLHTLTQIGLIAALYAVLTLCLPMASFGSIQIRFSEALTVLAVFGRKPILGLTLGCALANAIGLSLGMNIAGAWDIAVGSAATLVAALLSYATRRVTFKGLPLLAVWPPVLINAVVIGGELNLVLCGGAWESYPLFALQIGLGQLIPCVVGGCVVAKAVQKSKSVQKMLMHR